MKDKGGLCIFLALCWIAMASMLAIASAEIRINEVMANSSCKDNCEWIEIYSGSYLEMTNWIINTTEQRAIINYSIGNQSNYLIITKNKTSFENFYNWSNMSNLIEWGGMGLRDSDDSVYLINNSGIVSSFSYNTSNKNYSWSLNASGSWQLCTPSPGRENNCTGAGANRAPTITITSPVNASTHYNNETIIFTANATDAEDGALAPQWKSSIDGILGTGSQINKTLSIGNHTITANATDSKNSSAWSTITLVILNSTSNMSAANRTSNPAPWIDMILPEKIYSSEEFAVEVRIYNFNSTLYDVKIWLEYNGTTISEINDNESWKSGFYYIDDALSGINDSANFTIRLKENYGNFSGNASLNLKLRENGIDTTAASYSANVTVYEGETADDEGNTEGLQQNQDSPAVNNTNNTISGNVIYLNPPKEASTNNGERSFASKQEIIARYAIYGFAFLCVIFAVIVIIRKI